MAIGIKVILQTTLNVSPHIHSTIRMNRINKISKPAKTNKAYPDFLAKKKNISVQPYYDPVLFLFFFKQHPTALSRKYVLIFGHLTA